MRLSSKTIIITGASSGIGACAAALFAAEGARVVLGARRDTLLQALSSSIRESGGQAVHLAGDVRDEDYAAELVALAVSEFGGLDGAFNNAGTVGEMGPIPDMPAENWQQVLSVNLDSAFYAAKHQIPALRTNRGGPSCSLLHSSGIRSAFPGWAPMPPRRRA